MSAFPSSFSSFSEYFSTCLKFLEDHYWIYNFPVVDIFVHDVTASIPHSWVVALSDVTDEELKKFPDNMNKETWPESLCEFYIQCDELKIETSVLEQPKTLFMPDYIQNGITIKKMHEVKCLLPVIHLACEQEKISKIVDIGSGCGYIDFFLFFLYNYRILGVESEKDLIETARANYTKLRTSLPPTHSGEVKYLQNYLIPALFKTIKGAMKLYFCNSTKKLESNKKHNLVQIIVNDENSSEVNEGISNLNLSENKIINSCTNILNASTSESKTDSTAVRFDEIKLETNEVAFKTGVVNDLETADEIAVKTDEIEFETDVNDLETDEIDLKTNAVATEVITACSASQETNNHICMIGLHTCGDLCIDCFKLFMEEENCKVCILVPCCYHKMSKQPEQKDLITPQQNSFKNFPLSECMKVEANKVPGILAHLQVEFLRLAGNATGRKWFHMKPERRENQLFYTMARAVIQLYCYRNGLTIEKNRRRCVTKMRDECFKIYLDSFLSRCTLKTKSGEIMKVTAAVTKNITDLWDECKEKRNHVKIILCLQASIQFVAESLIIVDRVKYLLENNMSSVKLIKLFNETLSPRAYAICAQK